MQLLRFGLAKPLHLWYDKYMESKTIAKDLSSMTRAELEQNIVELTTEVESQKQKIQWLEEQFHLLQQKRFGVSSETGMIDDAQMSLFNEAEWTVDEAGDDIPEPDMSKVAPPKRKKTKGGKDRMVSGLPKEVIDFRLSKEEMICPNCGSELTEVRKTVRKELIVIPAQVKVREYHDAVYTCRNCQRNGIENPMHTGGSPKPLLRNALVSASFIAYIICRKLVEGIPLYRQEAGFKRRGIRLTRQTMSSWMIRCTGQYLEGVYEILRENLLKRDVIQADETPLQVLHEPRKSPTSDSYMWLYRTGIWDPGSQIVLYDYQDNRRQENPANFLGNFKGFLHTDGYSGYNSVTKREKEPATSVGCWAHARRFYCDALKALSKADKELPHTNIDTAIAYCDKIFEIERDNELADKSPEERLRVRKEKTIPVLDAYFEWVHSFDPDHIIKGKFRDGIVYSQNQEVALRAFTLDGRLQCSNNAAERSIKPFVICRKNFLFCNTPSGARTTAVAFSLVETAKANDLDPFKYLEYIFEKLSQDDDYDLELLMPWTDDVRDTCAASTGE